MWLDGAYIQLRPSGDIVMTYIACRRILDASLSHLSADAGDEHYDAFVHKHSRRHLSKQEYQQRSQRFHEVKGMVEVCTFCLLVFSKALQRMALQCDAQKLM